MENTFIPKGAELIRQAVDADNSDQLELALSLYKSALRQFVTGLKYVTNDTQKSTINERIKQYIDRAEQIDSVLKSRSNSTVVSDTASTSGGGVTVANKVNKDGTGTSNEQKDSHGNPIDPDTAKLELSLSGAIVKEKPNIKWSDVAGLDQAKSLLKEAVILPVKYPQLFNAQRRPWKGILLYGPPGTGMYNTLHIVYSIYDIILYCIYHILIYYYNNDVLNAGKSYLAKAVATESGASCFLSVSSSDLVSKYQGESERLVKSLFELARRNKPSIVFIDEVDSLCGSRSDGENESSRRIKTEFLVQMQGVGKDVDGVLVLGATNTPWDLDPAVRRRFEKRVYIPLPDVRARYTIIKLSLGDTPNTMTDEQYKLIAEHTESFSGADISVLTRDALYEPVRICQLATHFHKIADSSGKHEYLYEPCSSGASDAIEMNLFDIPDGQLSPIPVSYRHFENALLNAKPSVGQGDLLRFEEWTKQFGQDG